MDFSDVTQIKINGSEIKEVHLNNTKIWEKPSLYTELDYIESTGTQYIDTGIAPINTASPGTSAGTCIDIDFAYIGGNSSVWVPIYGRRGTDKSTYFCLFIRSNTLKLTPNYGEFDPGNYSNITVTAGRKINVRTVLGSFYYNDSFNGSCSTSGVTITQSDKTIYLFDNNPTMSRATRMKLYGCKFYYYTQSTQNFELVKDFIPVLDKNNVPCLYEQVNGEFYYNLGSGTFNYGLKGA